MATDDPSHNPDRAQVAALRAALHTADADVQRMRDQIAFLTRDRARWRDRALQAEARLGVRVGCGGAA